MSTTAVSILEYVILIIGIIVSVHAARQRKNNGYLVIAIFFALTIVNIAVNRVPEPRVDQQMLQQDFQTQPAVIRTPARTAVTPLLHVILIAGVWLAARDARRVETADQQGEEPAE